MEKLESRKIIMVGDVYTGKTCMIIRLIHGYLSTSQQPTIGAAFLNRQVTLSNGKRIELKIWDTSGDERYDSVMPVYYRGASCAFCVFDVSERPTFEHLTKWVDRSREHISEKVPIIIIGAKCDKERQVTDEEAEKFARMHNCEYMRCSAATGENINEIFQRGAELTMEFCKADEVDAKNVNLNSNQSSSGGCC